MWESLKTVLLNVIILLNICLLSAAQKIQLFGATVTQIGTWGNHHAALAIDGNVFTYSVACINCDDDEIKKVPGWWRIDFQTAVFVAGIELFSCNSYPDRDYIQEIDVFVISTTGDSQHYDIKKCGDFKARNTYIKPMQRIVIICTQPLEGRSVTIQRKPRASVRPDVIAIAEAYFYSEVGDWVNRSTSIQMQTNNPYYIPEGEIIPLTNAVQSKTEGSKTADLAIDGDYQTFSTATSDSEWQQGWWQGDLQEPYTVTNVAIISSTDMTSAQYLRSFNIMVSLYEYANDPGFHRARKCTTITDPTEVPAQTFFGYKCGEPINGRYVIIKSTSGPISLAEVGVYV